MDLLLDPPDTFRLHRQNANWITEIIMKPIVSRWLFIGVLGLVIWRLIPLSTEQELASANRA
ncbi:hypothetical protein ASA01S_037_00150 [Aeromonas salmonicida subsp. masoucida NBRC 13784]|nr:hypothetical protein ASA01S_037_00150 [Aeromonas salmonicida subsp. masoucida NBRC 13784]